MFLRCRDWQQSPLIGTLRITGHVRPEMRDVAVFVSLSIRRRADQAGGVIVSPGRLPSVCAALLGFSPMEARSSVG